MSFPLVSVSGVRGIVGETFTPDLVRRWSGAFAQWCVRAEHPQIVLGRDTRPSGVWALDVASTVLREQGMQPVVAGVVPTPTAQLAVTYHRAAGGLVITGSHNPAEWNALKFLGPDGVFLSETDMEEVTNLANRDSLQLAEKKSGTPEVTIDDGAIARHIENVLTTLPITAERIRARRFRVVVDPVNGAGTRAVPRFLKELGCQVTVINGEPSGIFAHPPEPTPEHLAGLGERTYAAAADLGVAVDPDADRLVLVDERGVVLSEEYTVTLAVLSVLERQRESAAVPVVVNLSTTRMVDDVAKRYGTTVVRTPVGERHVVEGMRAHHAAIGGEGNGGVIDVRSHEGRDSLVGIALVLDLLTKAQKKLSEVARELPSYIMVKEKLPQTAAWDQVSAERLLSGAFPGAQCSTTDGVRIVTPRGWMHLRPSNTEPVVRLIVEGHDRVTVDHLRARAHALLAIPV